MTRMKVVTIAVVLAVIVTLGTRAQAQWFEVGDAGDLPGTAQAVLTGPLATISGFLDFSDADMYCITIDDPSIFSASTLGLVNFDSQLFLFHPDGMGIVFNDDTAGFGVQSRLPAGHPLITVLSPGPYLLAISGFDHDPVSVGGAIFPDTFPGVFGPTGPGGGSPVIGWSGDGGSGFYTIRLTGASGWTSGRVIPEPSALAAFGIGLGTLLFFGRRARKRR